MSVEPLAHLLTVAGGMAPNKQTSTFVTECGEMKKVDKKIIRAALSLWDTEADFPLN